MIPLLFFPLIFMGQTSISGIVNSYHPLIEVIPAKSCVRVNPVAGLSVNDLVMIIQMKGATVGTLNNSTFGSVSNLNYAGNYELNTICSIRGDSVFLYRQLLTNYSVTDKVQLVRIPQYTSALVQDSLKALPWDSASGQGGVLAISVAEDLILNDVISADGKGYAGGAYRTSNSTCSNFFAANNYYYNAAVLSPQDGACKGESVCSLGTTYSGGKGAVANGGGGGNNHNNGGGGGANLSAGGVGGGNASTSGCSTPNPARGGYALSNSGGTKIYPGGGGGAGHANSGFFSTGGGNGGGIIFLQANTLYSNGNKITANGVNGGNTLADGASGGGAGGTIILDINNYSGAVTLEANGGNGGNEDDDFTSGKCYGEGGGGSGGVMYFKTGLPSGIVSVNGGSKGNKLNSVACGTLNPATNGTAGSTMINYTYQQSMVITVSCSGTLATGLYYFTALRQGLNVWLRWQVTEATEYREFIIERKSGDLHWMPVSAVSASGLYYEQKDAPPGTGLHAYRIKMMHRDGHESYSFIRQVLVSKTLNQMLIYPNPAQKRVRIQGLLPGETVQIFDDKGMLVYQHTLRRDEQELVQNISFLAAGIYYVRHGGIVERLVVGR